jgi:asparagine synthase (glutamine-hydrolysing)
MCGILGAFPSVQIDQFTNALHKLTHRGPDGFGIWEHPQQRCTLGHRRLAIIDLSTNGKQPMHYANRYTITFNGEIYNYKELKEHLVKEKGCSFSSQSDTEVVLALYTHYGVSFLSMLNGMWAMAIFDEQTNELFISRDRIGKKPFFYTWQQGSFIFASEMKALYSFLPAITPNVTLVEQAKKSVFTYEATDECLINGIQRFPAASYGLIKNGRLTIAKFWNVSNARVDIPNTYGEQVQAFKALFTDACKLRMRSDVTIGTALSGGIDSSVTISTMAAIANTNPESEFPNDWQHAYVASFPGTTIDETADAKKVVDNIGINATYLTIDPLASIENIYHYTYMFEELYITSPIPMVQLYRAIKQNGTTVTLDGHGSDELFGGYPFDVVSKAKDDALNPLAIYQTLQTCNDASTGKGVTLNNVTSQLWKNSKSVIKGRKPALYNSYLNTQLHQSTFDTILPTLLRNYDRYSMINGVEIRMPFLDYRIIEFAFSLPAAAKVRNGFTKAIVRDAMKGVIPEEVRTLKRKIGFNSPFTEWLKGPLKNWVQDTINSQDFKAAQFIDQREVINQINNVIKNSHATYVDGEKAWTLLMPFIWEKSLLYASQ